MIAGIALAVFGSRISMAKNAPATGVLNMAEMPAAPPHASSRMRFSWFSSRLRATLLPMAAPVCATGASSPADTPSPTLTPLVMICEKVL